MKIENEQDLSKLDAFMIKAYCDDGIERWQMAEEIFNKFTEMGHNEACDYLIAKYSTEDVSGDLLKEYGLKFMLNMLYTQYVGYLNKFDKQ